MKRKVGAGKKHRGQFYTEAGFCAVDAVCVSEVKGFSTYSGLLVILQSEVGLLCRYRATFNRFRSKFFCMRKCWCEYFSKLVVLTRPGSVLLTAFYITLR
jgi:hypothetical protein